MFLGMVEGVAAYMLGCFYRNQRTKPEWKRMEVCSKSQRIVVLPHVFDGVLLNVLFA